MTFHLLQVEAEDPQEAISLLKRAHEMARDGQCSYHESHNRDGG